MPCLKRAVSSMLISLGVTTASICTAGVHLPVPYMSQPDNQTCLPTSFMMAVNFMGRIDEFSSATVQELHKTCQYNRFNTPDLARKFGLYALPNWHNLGWTPDTVKYELDHGRPVVLGVNQGRHGHFILAIGYTDDNKVIVHDPSSVSIGYGMGGPNQVMEWKELLWRGGIILRPDPFPEPPPLSGVAIGDDGGPLEGAVHLELKSGDDAQASFTLVNNGRVAWPDKLYLSPVDPDSSPTAAVASNMASGWLSPDRTTEALPGLQPGTTGTVTFSVKAPEVEKTTTFLQYFNLHDDQGNWFGNHWQTGPGHRNMAVRMIVRPRNEVTWDLPVVDTWKDGKSSLNWDVKFGDLELTEAFSPAPPETTEVVKLLTDGRYSDSATVGSGRWTDYRVEAWIYCDLRTHLADRGWERTGIFARDNGQHMGDTKNEVEIGSSLVMTVDSDDGSIRAGYVQNGSIGDYRNKRHKLTESGWHHFAITCKGDTATYELDGKPFHTETGVRAYSAGESGVYYNSSFDPTLPQQNKQHGVIFSGFKVSPAQ